MSNLVLVSKETGDYKPHPEGIVIAACNDVIDLGLVETEYQGQRSMKPKVKLCFESDMKMEDGKPFTITKNFTASLHPKSKLAAFLGKWRGRPVAPGESIDLGKLIGACCTLVISHQQNLAGKTYAAIDAVSKPTKKLGLSGSYDPAATRQRIAEWNAKQGAGARPQSAPTAPTAPAARPPSPVPAGHPLPSDGRGANKSAAPATAQPAAEDNIPFDPEVGF